MSTKDLCSPSNGPSTLPNLSPDSLYCLTPNTMNETSISSMVQACCGASNALQKMGGCDYCVVDEPRAWSNSSDDDRTVTMARASCLTTQALELQPNMSGIYVSCHVPGESSGVAAVGGAAGGRAGWALWGLVVLVGFGCVSGSML
jgi:hypothetical protein